MFFQFVVQFFKGSDLSWGKNQRSMGTTLS